MLSHRLKEVLKAEGKTNYRLSKVLDIDQAQLSRFFNGKGGISLKNLERILDYLGYEITLNKAMRREEEKVKSKTPEQIGIAKKGDYRYILRCWKCNTSFDRPEFTKKLTNEELQQIECKFCFKKGYVEVEQLPIMYKINTEKKRQVSRDKIKRKMMELPFKDRTDKEREKHEKDSPGYLIKPP